MNRIVRLAAAEGSLAALLLSNPSPASADGQLQAVGGAGCVNGSNSTFQCFVTFRGGVAPYTLTAASTSNAYAYIEQAQIMGSAPDHEAWVQGSCVSGKQSWIYLTVSDSNNQSLSVTRNLSCGSMSDV